MAYACHADAVPRLDGSRFEDVLQLVVEAFGQFRLLDTEQFRQLTKGRRLIICCIRCSSLLLFLRVLSLFFRRGLYWARIVLSIFIAVSSLGSVIRPLVYHTMDSGARAQM